MRLESKLEYTYMYMTVFNSWGEFLHIHVHCKHVYKSSTTFQTHHILEVPTFVHVSTLVWGGGRLTKGLRLPSVMNRAVKGQTLHPWIIINTPLTKGLLVRSRKTMVASSLRQLGTSLENGRLESLGWSTVWKLYTESESMISTGSCAVRWK